MLFNSFDFWLGFLPVYGLYLLLRRRAQNVLLLAASAVFYGWWDWRFLGLLWGSTLLDYYCALGIANARGSDARRRYMGLSAAGNLGALGLLKYFNFFMASAQALAASLGLPFSPVVLNVVVPVGLSFYTFQTLGYTLDVYRRRAPAATDLLDFSLFVSFFPQLVAGPIEPSKRLLPQIQAERRVTRAHLERGAWLCFWGLFQKAVVADNLARLVDPVLAEGASPAAGSALAAFYAFPLQVYCDFAGYSDIARGLASLMGFELSVNFRLPFFASDPRDFWKRWHITLAEWFREHVYIPLGGSRAGEGRTRRNLLIVFLLMGLWHGASAHFVYFGLYWAVVTIAYRAFASRGSAEPRGFARAWRALLMFHVVAVGAALFRVPSMESLAALAGAWLAAPALPAAAELRLLVVVAAPLLVVDALRWPDREPEAILERPIALKAPLYLWLMLWHVWLASDAGKEYVYFQF